MEIRIDVLQLLQKLLVEVPLHTPHRIQFIQKEIHDYVIKFQQDSNYVLLDINLPDNVTKFSATLEHVSFLANQLPRVYLHNSFKSVKKVLIPHEIYCCDLRLRI